LNSEIRTPKAPALPEPPSEILQEHSNHFFWPFLHEVGESSTDPDAVISLALVDSRTSFLGCVPMNGKA
jgi:hypothetical protein